MIIYHVIQKRKRWSEDYCKKEYVKTKFHDPYLKVRMYDELFFHDMITVILYEIQVLEFWSKV